MVGRTITWNWIYGVGRSTR
jgi:hypothetical protein